MCFTSLKAFLISLFTYLLPSVDISAREGRGRRMRPEEEVPLGIYAWNQLEWSARQWVQGLPGWEAPGQAALGSPLLPDTGSHHRAHCGPRVPESRAPTVHKHKPSEQQEPQRRARGTSSLGAARRACPAAEENFQGKRNPGRVSAYTSTWEMLFFWIQVFLGFSLTQHLNFFSPIPRDGDTKMN